MLLFNKNKVVYTMSVYVRLRGATVARLTPDQKVACSNHVGVNAYYFVKNTVCHFLMSWVTVWAHNEKPK